MHPASQHPPSAAPSSLPPKISHTVCRWTSTTGLPVSIQPAHQSTRCASQSLPPQEVPSPSPNPDRSDLTQPSSTVTVPSPFALSSLPFWLGLVSLFRLHALGEGLGPVSLNSHRTAPSTTAPAPAAAALSATLLRGTHPSILLLRVVPPLFLSFNLFSTLIFSTQTTLSSLALGRNTRIPPHPTSLDSIQPLEPSHSSPSTRRNRIALPSTPSALLLRFLGHTSRSLENFSTTRLQDTFVTVTKTSVLQTVTAGDPAIRFVLRSHAFSTPCPLSQSRIPRSSLVLDLAEISRPDHTLPTDG
ncbi:hypothetical protein CH63R_07866 [Colletotrichum higginsianum IMI 349063]|uniref:Uncharacterized protein n=1 Tax=Colletotrichum higginsianum (strain IMI 349063) TaxID=759273 RepID=A0A1B7YAH5_COLHI|nr:hypothetical protein CH63R_07866 [Colletotrichum higginsianum IMI 349063]OBR09101.1 hypothetical protein CH63R_07866 [Colletotrichum higginsianum IMI 349063]